MFALSITISTVIDAKKLNFSTGRAIGNRSLNIDKLDLLRAVFDGFKFNHDVNEIGITGARKI